ncbi:MAG TPA: SurA N-terminal domain-containing protein [Kaistiaceae bacterium]|nr:SurA N-terminal domain-containing protein [Kaistiaceae bacterium]
MARFIVTARLAATIRLAAAACLAVAAVALLPASASAQVTIKALVNDEPITSFDVGQRKRLLALSGESATDKKALDELIDERLQLQEATRRNVAISDAEVEGAYNSIAQRSKISAAQLSQALRSRGIDPSTLKDRIRASVAWRQVVQMRFRATIQVREQDIVAELQKKGDETKVKTTEFTLKQVIFVFPDKASNGVKEQRRREAEALRSRFTSCANSLEIVKGLRDVAVRDLGKRNGSELTPELAKSLEETAIGHLTKPQVEAGGVNLIAVCDKREIVSEAAAQDEVKSEMLTEQGEILARRYIRDLRQDAVIEYR